MNTEKTIYVHLENSSENLISVGKLFVNFEKGTERFSFAFDEAFLSSEYSTLFFDAYLYQFQCRQYLPSDKALFGVFSDAAPDRWGRLLMKRREAIVARNEDRKPRKLTESDYLLGVYDESRMGALRFSLAQDGPFLSDEKDYATPPFEYLRKLEEASREFEKDENLLEDKWVRQLIGPGSSLGGARPKATVKDVDGSLWMAKFPSKNDDYDVGAWEQVAHDLAMRCGLNVPEAKLMRFSKLGSTFLVKRFDRNGKQRIPFMSAMTALGKKDGASAADGTSYLDIVSFIRANGAEPKADLEELWRRIVFNMAVSNTDDHLRNHGFIMTPNGWRLSPLYDVNPFPDSDYLALNIDDEDNSISIDLAISSAKYFGITDLEAERKAKEILSVVGDNWEKAALRYGIGRSSIEYMRPAFSEGKREN